MSLLARREHSATELARKLCDRGFDGERVAECICQLQQEGLQSDGRFAGSYVYMRVNRGYGPLRIRSELAERGVSEESVTEALAEFDGEWAGLAEQARCKRFGRKKPVTYEERARQARFLQYRGFTTEHFRTIFAGSE